MKNIEWAYIFIPLGENGESLLGLKNLNRIYKDTVKGRKALSDVVMSNVYAGKIKIDENAYGGGGMSLSLAIKQGFITFANKIIISGAIIKPVRLYSGDD